MTTTDHTAPATPGEALDLDAIEREWLVQCGPCDYGLVEMGCACPAGDYRPPMAKLVAEVRRLRAQLAGVRENRDDQHAAATRLSHELEQARRDLGAARTTDPTPATPPEHQRARQGRFPLWMHTCGSVETFGTLPGGADAEPETGGCDACESGSDNPAEWRPLYATSAPLSSTPPAGTEPASATAVDPPLAEVSDDE